MSETRKWYCKDRILQSLLDFSESRKKKDVEVAECFLQKKTKLMASLYGDGIWSGPRRRQPTGPEHPLAVPVPSRVAAGDPVRRLCRTSASIGYSWQRGKSILGSNYTGGLSIMIVGLSESNDRPPDPGKLVQARRGKPRVRFFMRSTRHSKK